MIQVRSQAEAQAPSWRRNEIIINGATWAVRCITEDLPKAASVQIVDDVGYMPMDAVTVQKNQPNQTMLESVAGTRGERSGKSGRRRREDAADPGDLPGAVATVPDGEWGRVRI